MFIYFAVSPSKQHFKVLAEEKVESILLSYAFVKNPERVIKLLDGYEPKRLTIDSGAFSAWSRGAEINLEEYANFCVGVKELLPKSIELNIVNLDVLPGKWGFVPSKEQINKSCEQGWQNMLYLESKGLKVIHVFHQHEDWSVLDKLCAHSDYIGISTANDVSMLEKYNWMKKVFSRIKGTVKTHGFAVTSHNQLYNFPYYSVDSSSWCNGARYGYVTILDDHYELRGVKYKDINHMDKYWDYLSDLGIDKLSSPTWHDRVRVSIRSYKRLQEIATRLWTERGVKWDGVDNSVVLNSIANIINV